MHAIALATQDLTGLLGRPSQHDLLAARQMPLSDSLRRSGRPVRGPAPR